MDNIWERINLRFGRLQAQLRVVKTLFKFGLSVKEDGIYCGEIKIPDSEIARVAKVDRRVVKATIRSILSDEELTLIFSHIRPTIFLGEVASVTGMGIIEIIPRNASEPGVISEVTSEIARSGISIRQVAVDDPYLSEDARMTIITEKKLPGELIDRIRKLGSVRSVVVY